MLAAGLASLVAAHILRRAHAQWCLHHPNRDSLEKAISVDPEECEGYFTLAVYNSLSTDYVDPRRQEELFRQALRCQPLKSKYWLGLASFLQYTGGSEAAAVAAEGCRARSI